MNLRIVFLFLIIGSASAEQAYVIKSTGNVQIHVIEFTAEENFGFEAHGIQEGQSGLQVSNSYIESEYVFVINGGYFDGNLNPIGYCRINHVDLSKEVAPRLSGYLTITDSGELNLHWKTIPGGTYKDILQSGPFLIDPNGKMGIHTRSGQKAKRTVIGKTIDDKILILTTNEVYLYDLANILKKEIPNLDRALNLDGGPSGGLIYKDTVIENVNPVSNIIRKRRSL